MLDGFYWNEQLPHSIEAMLTSGDPDTARIYQDFLQTYGLNADQIPLLKFTKNEVNPFVSVQGSGGTMSQVGASGSGQQHIAHSGDLSQLGYGR